jgi:hypothetical protein
MKSAHCRASSSCSSGRPAGKTALLHDLAKSKGITPLNVGAELGGRLAGMPNRDSATCRPRRSCVSWPISMPLTTCCCWTTSNCCSTDPFSSIHSILLKRHAHAKRVVAVWPGELQGDARTGRLTYADMGHPEHQDYSLAGVVPFEIQ